MIIIDEGNVDQLTYVSPSRPASVVRSCKSRPEAEEISDVRRLSWEPLQLIEMSTDSLFISTVCDMAQRL